MTRQLGCKTIPFAVRCERLGFGVSVQVGQGVRRTVAVRNERWSLGCCAGSGTGFFAWEPIPMNLPWSWLARVDGDAEPLF